MEKKLAYTTYSELEANFGPGLALGKGNCEGLSHAQERIAKFDLRQTKISNGSVGISTLYSYLCLLNTVS